MKNQHTPAPWKAEIENGGGGLNIQSAAGQSIGHTSISRDTDGTMMITDEAQANARLIAAAPELLDALKLVAEIGKPSRHGFDNFSNFADAAALAQIVSALIYQLTGE